MCVCVCLLGLGHVFREEVLIDETGKLISDGTWECKPPSFRCIPERLEVYRVCAFCCVYCVCVCVCVCVYLCFVLCSLPTVLSICLSRVLF
jgi:hypothetical protein